MPIIDGCYNVETPRDVIGPPIALYHPVFAQFKADINNENLSIPDGFLRQTVQLMHTLSGLYQDEDTREETLEPVFKQLFGESRGHRRPDATPDRDIFVHRKLVQQQTTSLTTAAVMIGENKRGLGESGNASVQVCFSMMKFWLNDKAQLFHRNCCCPTLLIVTSGPWLVIISGIAVDYFIFQHLTDTIWLGRDSALDEHHARRVALILFLLKRGIDTLRNYYETVPIRTGSVVFAPSIKKFIGEDNQRKGFEYITKLQPKNPACVTFLAQTKDHPPEKIVVKFVDRYGEKPHRLLEKVKMAPKLYACHDLNVLGDFSYDGLKIVVMEYLKGTTASEAFYRHSLPPCIVSGIKAALDVLHKEDFVFGDLRCPNIRITLGNKDQELVNLIDFDWAGKHDRDCYPLNISTAIKWLQGVQGLAKMMKEHDIEMLEMISTQYALIPSAYSERSLDSYLIDSRKARKSMGILKHRA